MGKTQLFTNDKMVLSLVETRSSLSKSREEETWEEENFHNESQGGRHWKGPLEESYLPTSLLKYYLQ